MQIISTSYSAINHMLLVGYHLRYIEQEYNQTWAQSSWLSKKHLKQNVLISKWYDNNQSTCWEWKQSEPKYPKNQYVIVKEAICTADVI